MFLTTKALVLREVRYRESDKILTILTEKEGKLTVNARQENGLWDREEEEHLEYIHEPEILQHCLEQAGFDNIIVRRDGPQHTLGRLFLIAENGKD